MLHVTQEATNTVVGVSSKRTSIQSITCSQRSSSAPVLYMQIFNNVPGSITLGTTKPNCVLMIPAGVADLQRAYIKATFDGIFGGLYFATALSFAVTTTPDGSTGPSAGQRPEVIINYNEV